MMNGKMSPPPTPYVRPHDCGPQGIEAPRAREVPAAVDQLAQVLEALDVASTRLEQHLDTVITCDPPTDKPNEVAPRPRTALAAAIVDAVLRGRMIHARLEALLRNLEL